MGLAFKCHFSGDSQVGNLEIPEIGTPITLQAHDVFCTPLIEQSCSPHQELSNGLWHATYKQLNQGIFLLLMVGNQIGNLIPNPSFHHNLYFKVPKWFMRTHFRHLHSKSFLMINGIIQSNEFWPLKSTSENLEIHQDSNSQSGNSLGSLGGVHSFTLSYIPKSMKCDSRASLLAHTFANLCFGCEPKARVVTHTFHRH